MGTAQITAELCPDQSKLPELVGINWLRGGNSPQYHRKPRDESQIDAGDTAEHWRIRKGPARRVPIIG